MMNSPLKFILLIGDGMGDLPLEALQGKTPLQAARTPAMDFVADHGSIGQVRTVPEGFPPGSDVANLSLLGYLPEKVYSGRAPLEAASLGVDLLEGEIAFRCNLVNLRRDDDSVTMIDYSADHITTAEARELIGAINTGFHHDAIKLYPGFSYRHLLVYRGEVSSLETVPPHDYTGQDVTGHWRQYRQVPDLKRFMDSAGTILDAHPLNRQRSRQGKRPANGVWLWGAGKAPSMLTLQERFGLSGALISAVDLLKGIGVYAGMEVIPVNGATGYLDTNYEGKVEAAMAALQDRDLVVVHVEAPDETGHQGDLAKKIQAIEDFDSRIVAPILARLKEGPPFRLAVCMDHFTPLSLKTHSRHPVPFALYDSRQPARRGRIGFSEEIVEKCDLRFEQGEEFFRFVTDRSEQAA